MLRPFFQDGIIEAGCDEAGRGCLAGPVVAAAVIFPQGYTNPEINDSKCLTERKRNKLRDDIMRDAIAWAIGLCNNQEIDRINILQASITSMHRALNKLTIKPQFILVDGNKFRSYSNIPHKCIIHGDALFLSIAAASVLAKTYRDELMYRLDSEFPEYGWEKNKGYPTREHRKAVEEFGPTPYHRMSFGLLKHIQPTLF
jgi:ribonuclease HII